MKPESFESLDKAFKARFDKLSKKVPSRLLDGFSASVERRILEKRSAPEPRPIRRWAPAWVPALAVLVVSILALRMPHVGPLGYPDLSSPAALSQEIAVLRDVGAWSEDDEKLIETSDEAAAEELESLPSKSGSARFA